MKNPYLYGYLPLFTIILFSLTFSVNAVSVALKFINDIGVYTGIREFLSDFELRIFLLIVFLLLFFMLFSALKLIGETIHELGLLFFSKDRAGETVHIARGGYVIFFFGGLLSAVGVKSFILLLLIFVVTVFSYFVFTIFKHSQHMTTVGMFGMIFFEIIMWILLISTIVYALLKLYNGLLSTLPFT